MEIESLYDAISLDLANARVTYKHMACILWPGRRPETAMGLFSRAMNPDNVDVHLTVEHLQAIMTATGGAAIVAYLCDACKFERPKKKTSADVLQELKDEFTSMTRALQAIARKIDCTVPVGEGTE